MGPGMGMGRPPWEINDGLKPKKPTKPSEVLPYLKKVLGGFFKRLFYIFGLVWEAKPILLFVMIFMAVFNGVMPVVGSYISANLLNSLSSLFTGSRELSEAELAKLIIVPLALQFGYLFFTRLVNAVSGMITSISGEVVTNHVKVKIMKKAKEIDLARYDMPEFYEKLENANREAGMRPIHILNSTFSLVSNIISIVSYILILIAISPFAPLIVIVISVPSAIITFVYKKKNFQYMRHRSKDRRQMAYYSEVQVNKDLVKEVKLFGLSDTFVDRYNGVFKSYFKGLKKLIVGEGVWNVGMTLFTTVVNCGLFFYIAYNVYKGNGQIGDYSLYTGALTSISSGVTTLVNVISQVYEGSLFIDNLIVFMNEKKTITSILAEPAPLKRHCGHTLELRDVSFRYPGTSRDVLKNINLTIEPGDTVVMVGLNGAGKTTLIKLLTRLYDPTEGVILLDGHDIREYDVDELYKMYGIIFQDFGKYAVSVKENIAFGNIEKGIVDSEVVKAAGASNADEYIEQLPQKYDTPLMRYFESDGIELSIGQWQKLSIARAFYSDSDILILDEPTASLDAIAEQEVFSQFDKLRKDKTTIFVSHRLSSATVASKILVLSEGELIEQGNHEELMAKKGEYYRLFSTQAKRYISSAAEEINDGKMPLFPTKGKGFPPKRFD
ncbi:MAG: ABC transporter ATP-binding protein [Ruminococcaceae bacterium]|nr:ABC transporter ATP-binding protein [Oscillospiraceae bacterium]